MASWPSGRRVCPPQRRGTSGGPGRDPRPPAAGRGWPWPRPSARPGLLRHLDLALEDLAGRALGELVHEPDLARVLVAGDLLLHEALELVGGDVLPLLEDHGGADLLAHRLVGHADHRGLEHALVLVEDLLDLARVDVVAAADDQLLLAVDDEEVAVLVDLAHVAGVEPAVDDPLVGFLGLVPVALHDVVALDGDLADLALLDVV